MIETLAVAGGLGAIAGLLLGATVGFVWGFRAGHQTGMDLSHAEEESWG